MPKCQILNKLRPWVSGSPGLPSFIGPPVAVIPPPVSPAGIVPGITGPPARTPEPLHPDYSIIVAGRPDLVGVGVGVGARHRVPVSRNPVAMLICSTSHPVKAHFIRRSPVPRDDRPVGESMRFHPDIPRIVLGVGGKYPAGQHQYHNTNRNN